MRQVGVLAAAAIVALEQMVERLAEDHENARALAMGLADIDGLDVDLDSVQSNIVIFRLTNPALSANALTSTLASEGVKVGVMDRTHIRAVTHYGIERKDIDDALAIVRKALNG